VSSGAHRSIDFANYAACIALKWFLSCRSQSEMHDTANSRRKKKKLLLITISLLLLFLASELAGKKLNNSLQGNAGVGANLSAYAQTLLDDSLGIVVLRPLLAELHPTLTKETSLINADRESTIFVARLDNVSVWVESRRVTLEDIALVTGMIDCAAACELRGRWRGVTG
jgi:hypothetical protein